MESPPTTHNFPQSNVAMKTCTTCKRQNIYEFERYKNCTDCREKNRLRSQDVAQRKLSRQIALAPAPATVTAAATAAMYAHEEMTTSWNDSSEDENQVAVMLTPTGAKKRKASKSLRALSGDEKRVSLKQLKTSLARGVNETSGITKMAAKHAPAVRYSAEGATVYQTAAVLYDTLKRNNTISLNFCGYHSIVTVPTIDHVKRIELVSNDLRKISRLSFEHPKAVHSYDFESRARIVKYKCTCLGYRNPQPSAALEGTAPMMGIPRKCGGKIVITAGDDASHPFISGQRITVRVEHSKGPEVD